MCECQGVVCPWRLDVPPHWLRLVERTSEARGWSLYNPACDLCGRRQSSSVPHAFVNRNRHLIVRSVPDNGWVGRIGTCQRCKANGQIEDHHWAPRSVFADADQWGTVPLCKPCHAEWHRSMLGYTNRSRSAA